MNKMFEHISAFEKKSELFQVQLNKVTLMHFTCVATSKMEFPNLDMELMLHDEFAKRVTNFRQNEIKLKLFAQPFDLVVEDCPHDCQNQEKIF